MVQATQAGPPTLVIGNRNYSSWSLRAWFFLSHCKIEFETVRLALDTSDFAEQIATYSPTRRVPVLLHDGQTIWDSLAVCEYAAENLTACAGWPESREARALARSIACEMHAGFDSLRRELPMNCRASGRSVVTSKGTGDDIERIVAIWNECRGQFAEKGPWLFGEFGIVDAMYAPVALRFRTYGIQLQGAAADWVELIVRHPSIVAWTEAAMIESEVIESEEVGADL
ncbi:MAG: glutathione S-transferase family protein [Gammaproteobacteria bacterium]